MFRFAAEALTWTLETLRLTKRPSGTWRLKSAGTSRTCCVENAASGGSWSRRGSKPCPPPPTPDLMVTAISGTFGRKPRLHCMQRACSRPKLISRTFHSMSVFQSCPGNGTGLQSQQRPFAGKFTMQGCLLFTQVVCPLIPLGMIFGPVVALRSICLCGSISVKPNKEINAYISEACVQLNHESSILHGCTELFVQPNVAYPRFSFQTCHSGQGRPCFEHCLGSYLDTGSVPNMDILDQRCSFCWRVMICSGGYNTRRHGSVSEGTVDAIQIESSSEQRSDEVRPLYAR